MLFWVVYWRPEVETYVRTQVLLEPAQRQALIRIAEQEGRSVSEVIREMVSLQIRQRLYNEMGEAAGRLAAEYRENEDLSGMTALDGEDFFDA